MFDVNMKEIQSGDNELESVLQDNGKNNSRKPGIKLEDGKWILQKSYTDNENSFKTLDPNPLHYRGDFERENISEKTGFEKPIAPGMWMISLAEQAIEELYKLPLTNITVKRFVNPVEIDTYLKCVINVDDEQKKVIEKPKENRASLDSIEKKIKCLTFNRDKDREVRAFNVEYDFRPRYQREKIKGYSFKREINGEDYGNYLESIGIKNGLFRKNLPRTYFASALISKALISVSEIEESGLGFYRSMNINFFDAIDDIEGGNIYQTKINEKDEILPKNDKDLPQYVFNIQGYNPKEDMIMDGIINVSLFKDMKKE
ncbi:hypothetical protein GF336_06020 [Candidatus Woesearchaeota archaeon]|nr:hypothetical protein [Candidatus Woesearchaeota archaeon]